MTSILPLAGASRKSGPQCPCLSQFWEHVPYREASADRELIRVMVNRSLEMPRLPARALCSWLQEPVLSRANQSILKASAGGRQGWGWEVSGAYKEEDLTGVMT